MYEDFYVHEKFLRTRNCRRKFIKNYFLNNAKKTCKPNYRDLIFFVWLIFTPSTLHHLVPGGCLVSFSLFYVRETQRYSYIHTYIKKWLSAEFHKQPSRVALTKKVFCKYAASLQENPHAEACTSTWVFSCKLAAYFQNTFLSDYL